jgi:asparagine synthase (glutamine-hydrolysing)
MCGIAGILGLRDESRLKRMCDVMQHRGPDGEGFYFDENISLGMRRLSIIDLRTGDQPIYNEDRSIVIVFNGEIYNYKKLRKGLKEKGHRFYTDSDTESIVHLFEDYGIECVNHLEGMFAFAIWDKNKQRLFIARDRLGVKPLYYCQKDGKFIFSSEVKVILASGMVPKELDKQAVYHYLSYYCVPSPWTIIKDVRCLPPGYLLTISQRGEAQVKQYWDVEFKGVKEDVQPEDVNNIRHQIRELVTEAVEKRLISDVPLGAFLSGGIDSSIIVGLMSRMMSQPVQTFSVGFTSSEDKQFDERSFAKLIAEKFKTDHREVIVNGRDVYQYIPRLIWYMDQPSGDAIQTYFVSEAARNKLTVSLSGLGGDELFGGYRHFKVIPEILELEKSWNRIPGFIRKTLGGLSLLSPQVLKNRMNHKLILDFLSRERWGSKSSSTFDRKYELVRSIYKTADKHRLLTKEFVGEMEFQDSSEVLHPFLSKTEGLNVIDRISQAELKTYMPYMLLRDSDAMAMGISLEVRFPFTDYRLVEYVAQNVPAHQKVHNGMSKHILIDAFRDILPQEVTERRKRGFEFPMKNWLQNELRSIAENCLSSESIQRRGIFSLKEIEKVKRGFFDNYFRLPYLRVWLIVVLELWMRLYLDREIQNVKEITTEDLLITKG